MPGGEHDRRDGEALGQLVQEDGEEQQEPERGTDHEARGDRDAVEQGVYAEPEHREVRGRRPEERLGVDLLAEVKVRGHRVLEQVDAEVPEQDEDERVGHVDALGQHADERGGQHEARASGHEVTERDAGRAVRLRHHERAGEIRSRRDGRERELCYHVAVEHSMAVATQSPPHGPPSRPLGELLVSEGVTTADVVAVALTRSQSTGESLGDALVGLGAVTVADVLKALARQQGLPYLSRDELPSPLPVLKNLSPKYLKQYTVCPVSVDAGVLTVATADPLNPMIVDDLQQSTGLEVRLVVCVPEAITEAVEDTLRIRYRIDGILYDQEAPPRRLQAAVTSRIKIMAEMNIAERRLPQDGRIRVMLHGRRVDIRVSTIPTVYGESIVMRLLDRSTIFLPLDRLGFAPEIQASFERLIRRPHGIVLVTGPTGSGKTTTLYAALDKINSPDKKIITVEDPVEYQLKGINQIPVKPKIGLSFATGLRHIVRQDPDIIMIGEIRDLETAEIAIQASRTGHLVFSTLHTND